MANITVNLAEQWLQLEEDGALHRYPVSTAANGPGERQGSGGTPRGEHLVRARFGAGLPAGAVFQGRRFLGEIYSPALAQAHPQRDWVLTRILWLGGLQPGVNQGGELDSFARFIYIHGTPDSEPMGTPASHGCIRMRNTDLIALFDQVPVGTLVTII